MNWMSCLINLYKWRYKFYRTFTFYTLTSFSAFQFWKRKKTKNKHTTPPPKKTQKNQQKTKKKPKKHNNNKKPNILKLCLINFLVASMKERGLGNKQKINSAAKALAISPEENKSQKHHFTPQTERHILETQLI